MQVLSVQIGQIKSFHLNSKEMTTAIDKQPVGQPIYLGYENFNGDDQADRKNHGGTDKAVCVYAYEHYAHWEEVLERTLTYGAFGENLTVLGLQEPDVYIGDIYQLDEAVVQVSQPRQPCYKLGHHYNRSDLPLLVQQTGFSGFYFRVLQEGWISARPQIHLIQQDRLQVTLSFANKIMFRDTEDIIGIKTLLAVDALSASWRLALEKRLL